MYVMLSCRLAQAMTHSFALLHEKALSPWIVKPASKTPIRLVILIELGIQYLCDVGILFNEHKQISERQKLRRDFISPFGCLRISKQAYDFSLPHDTDYVYRRINCMRFVFKHGILICFRKTVFQGKPQSKKKKRKKFPKPISL